MSNDLKPYEKWMKDQLKDVDVPDMNKAWKQMSNLLQPAITNAPTASHKPWFGKWWIAGSVIVIVTTAVLFTKNNFKNNTQKQHIKTNIINNSKPITQNNQNNIEPVNNAIQNKWTDTLNSKTKEEEQDQQKNINLKNKIEVENKVAIKDKGLSSTIKSKNKLVLVNKEEKRNIIQNKRYTKNGNQFLQKDGLKNIYTKSNKKEVNSKSIAINSNNLSKSSNKKFNNKKQLTSTKQNIKKKYLTSNINKDKKAIKSKSIDNNSTLNAANKPLAKETNAEKQFKNIRYNVNTFTPTAVTLPDPTIINTNQQLGALLSKQLASSSFKKWSAKIGLTLNIPFVIGGQHYENVAFDGSDKWTLNFIPSPFFNIKYAFNRKWSIGFAPQFFVQQVPYNNVLSATIKAPVPTDSSATLTRIVRLANLYYSHFPLTVNYNISRKFELQAGIDAAILHNAVGYENSAYESPTNISVKAGINTSLTKKEFQTLHKFDIRALLGITYNLSNSWHFGFKFTQAFSSYLKKELAPVLASDPVSGKNDPIPSKNTNTSFQFFTRYDFNILKRKTKENEGAKHNNIIITDTLLSKPLTKSKKWSARVGLTINQFIPFYEEQWLYYDHIGIGAKGQWLLDNIPSLHFNIKRQLSPKWSLSFAPQFYVPQIANDNILDHTIEPTPFGGADTVTTTTRLSKMHYSHFPLSINYNINKRWEIQSGIDFAILHNAKGYKRTVGYDSTKRILFDDISVGPISTNRPYNSLHSLDIRGILGITYNLNNNLHCGLLLTQGFTSYIKNPQTFTQNLFLLGSGTDVKKNFSAQFFLKYDLDLLKKKNKKGEEAKQNVSNIKDSINQQQPSALQAPPSTSTKTKKWSARVGLTLNQPILIGIKTPHADQSIAFNGKNNQLLNYIPSPHFNIKYQINSKWNIGFMPQFYVAQLAPPSALDYYTEPIITDPGATKSIATVLSKLYYSHFPISINYNINKKFEVQTGIDFTILHNAVGINEIRYFKPGFYDNTFANNIIIRNQPGYKSLRPYDIRAMLGLTYNISKSLHFGTLFTQAFTSYLKPGVSFDPPVSIAQSPSRVKNVSLQLFLKYDLDLLKKKKINNKKTNK